jgi:glutathione synthase/RimK-type ligase-like ATP-grasp enzyme
LRRLYRGYDASMASISRIALATCDAWPALYGDEQSLPSAFSAAGVEARIVSWSDPAVDWRTFDRVAVRSTWDYFERIAEFRAWLDRLDALGVPLCNPTATVRWNFDKRYLRELESRGATLLPTSFLDAGARADLAALVRERGWSDAILKPAVSGGAYRTHRFAAAGAPALQPELDGILAQSGALIQPYAPEIAAEGEWSLLFFGGAFSHAAIKTPARGDFRVQTQFGGEYRVATAPPAMLEAARRIVAALPVPIAYARIDGLRRGDDFVLMEVEAIEPYLFLPFAPDPAAAVAKYVAAVCKI